MGDLSSVVQILALGGFLAGFAGIALVVAAASQNRPVRSGVLLAVGGLVIGVILLVISQGLLVVQPQERAVVFNTVSGNLENPRDPGISIVIPGIQQVFIYPVNQQNMTMSDSEGGGVQANDAIRARSVDGQEVRIDITILYQLDETELNQIHQEWRDGYESGLIRPTVRSIVRDVAARFEAEAIYGAGRENMQSQIDERLKEQLGPEGIVVTSTLVRDVTFSEEFIQSIEAAQVEQQRLQRAITEAERVRTEAEGQANAAIEAARGEAEAILVRARAEAEALRLVSEQIAANPNLIQYNYVQELADNVNLALVPSNSPFLFDFNSFTDLGDDFTAPPVPEPNVDEVVGTPTPDTDSDTGN